MNQPANTLLVTSSAITDRGLNERRPLNEDSFLADSSRSVFAVADGVGGAEAGEVASQTAVEVLDEAFRHQVDGADIEDLMELAIQRANASIHQMAQEHARFSMMATTIVALHISGNTATFGHVGDSRLYRLTPDGQLVRETEDHSVVEEEVRAGRMTPEQAANHPSKNVISRALGAESDVEVDMKTIEIEDGTQFLLCTDGITRHIPDYELRQMLLLNQDLAALCEELKTRCFERGAEDNLTAVLVRVGKTIKTEERTQELERTISPETLAAAAITASPSDQNGRDHLIPASRIAFPAPAEPVEYQTGEKPLNIEKPEGSSASGGTGRVFLFLLVIALLGGAFYAGRKYNGPIPFLSSGVVPPQPSPSPVPVEDPMVRFERARRQVDTDANAWLTNTKPVELSAQGIQNPLESNDVRFVYLFGRASLLAGNNEDAARAFESVLTRTAGTINPEDLTLRKEATLGLAAVSLRAEKERTLATSQFDQMLQKPATTPSP
jgi:protein phosphatase